MSLTNQERLSNHADSELEEAIDRTIDYAYQRMKGIHWQGVINGSVPEAKSAEDFTQEALEAVINGAKWDDSKPLWLVLRGIVSGKVNHLAESLENRSRQDSVEHREFLESAQGNADSFRYFPFNAGIDDELSEAFLLELTDALDDDPEAQSVVAAIWEGASKRSSIAEA
ncbi:MAG: hypothetical protein KDN22_33160, partial [Verrucomicrobiae bacterium]|nr:hypothetical protein [Verrucomicrobiae bacterium]